MKFMKKYLTKVIYCIILKFLDSTANVKSPPKDVKTNKNLQVRYKYQQPAQSIFRTEALSPVWGGGRKFIKSGFTKVKTILNNFIRYVCYLQEMKIIQILQNQMKQY